MISLTNGKRRFTKTSFINTTLDRIQKFHEDPRALSKLTPPPVVMSVRRDNRRSITDGDINFTLRFGPFIVPWIARHEPGPTGNSFADLQVEGPMAYWRHEHIFEPVAGGVELTDRITLAHRPGLPGLLTRLAFDGLPLRILFAYRHWRTRRETQLN